MNNSTIQSTLPAVKNALGFSIDAPNTTYRQSSMNSGQISGMKAQAYKTGGFLESDNGYGSLNLAGQQKYMANFRNSKQMKTGTTFAHAMTQPSNFEIAAMTNGFDPGHDVTIKDFRKKNIGDLKMHKTKKIAISKDQIEMVHGQLRTGMGLHE